ATGAIRPALQHLDRIACIEMEGLVASYYVNSRKRFRREQIVNRGRNVAVARVFLRQRTAGDHQRRAISLTEIAAFDRKRDEFELFDDLLGGEHCSSWVRLPFGWCDGRVHLTVKLWP